jgi:3-dehydroquinate synthase
LNFGHTIGHAVETYFLLSNERIFHGEAIALGMIAEAFIGVRKGFISEQGLTEISTYLISIFGKVVLPAKLDEILTLTTQDKKNKGGTILVALPNPIGKAAWDVPVTNEEITESLKFYQTF